MVYVFLADGFEEIEALAPVDVMLRAGLEVKTVGVTGMTVTGGHGIKVLSDISPEKVKREDVKAIFLPGGGLGTKNLEKSDFVQEIIDFAVEENILIASICAAPSILGHKNLLKDKEATAYPTFQQELLGARLSDDYVVQDGNYLTGRGMGVATEFGLKMVEILCGVEKSAEIKEQIQCRK